VFTADLLGAAPGALHVNMASISLGLAQELQQRHAAAQVRYLAAPVLGRPPVARAGQLNILAGGSEAVVEQARPVLEALGQRVWRVGDQPAAATLVKIAANYALIHALAALGETINLVERGGISGQLFVDLLANSFFPGPVYAGYGQIIADQAYFPAAFYATLGLKDLDLSQQAGAALGANLPTAGVLRQLFEAAVADQTLRDGDWAVIAEVIRGR
jgi:3-hydroxyisobutyrate dehydrogenase-like beta-hydroxyacid dehydrogenase